MPPFKTLFLAVCKTNLNFAMAWFLLVHVSFSSVVEHMNYIPIGRPKVRYLYGTLGLFRRRPSHHRLTTFFKSLICGKPPRHYLSFEDQRLFEKANHSVIVVLYLSYLSSTQPVICYLCGVRARGIIQVQLGCYLFFVTIDLVNKKTNSA